MNRESSYKITESSGDECCVNEVKTEKNLL